MIFSTRMQPMVQIARARMRRFWSSKSVTKVLTARMTRSGCVLADRDRQISFARYALFACSLGRRERDR